MRFADREALEVIVRVVSKTSLKRGRIVARQPAIIPAPGSMVDQMVQFAEFPTINQLAEQNLRKAACSSIQKKSSISVSPLMYLKRMIEQMQPLCQS